MYTDILLDEENFKGYVSTIEGKTNEINNLNRINILIGPNNSGKSRFLRNTLNHKDINHFSDTLKRIREIIKFIQQEIDVHLYSQQIKSIVNYESAKLDFPLWINKSSISKISDIVNYLEQLQRVNVTRPTYMNNSYSTGGRYTEIDNFIRSLVINAHPELTKLLKIIQNERELEYTIYIPTLRGLRGTNYYEESNITRPFKLESKEYDNYEYRTQNDYFRDGLKNNTTIYTGFHLFTDVRKLLLGKNKDREKIRRFEQFIADTFFGGKSFNIIPREGDHSVYISIDNEEDKPIYELGDGIQSIIILTYPLFFNIGKKMKVFYEEPDLFLHPGYQRIFMEAISRDEFKDFQFFFTTHSNHFLDMTLDYSNISVYAFRRIADKQFEIENVENANKDILQQLGVRNSSVFLTNCTIWVEGISDRIYLRKILELIYDVQSKKGGKSYQEDVHYSFVEYGGNNITHWSFLDNQDSNHPNINVERLCSKLFLLTDSDNAAENKNGKLSKKKERQIELLNKLKKERYHCLEGKEIENLLTTDTLLAIVRRRVEESEKENIKLRKGAKYTKNTSVGLFIDNWIEGKKNKFGKSSGTVINKAEFAKWAVAEINAFKDLSEDAYSLAEKLYKFIETHN